MLMQIADVVFTAIGTCKICCVMMIQEFMDQFFRADEKRKRCKHEKRNDFSQTIFPLNLHATKIEKRMQVLKTFMNITIL